MPPTTNGPRLARISAGDLSVLTAELEQRLQGTTTLESAAQGFVDVLADRFPTIVLARVYATMPLYRLPPREQAFARRVSSRASDETLTLTLLGTRGAAPEWNDRRSSQGHVAIPLVDQRFVAEVPMVAALLRALGVDLAWFDVPRDVMARRLVGGFNGVFHVPDARTATDEAGRNVIPAQDFVAQHGVKSVFGVGGSWLNGWMAAAIVFCRESVSQSDATAFAPLASAFKLATMHHVAAGRIFDP